MGNVLLPSRRPGLVANLRLVVFIVFLPGVFLEYLVVAVIELSRFVQDLDGFAHEVKYLFLLDIARAVLLVDGDRVAVPLEVGVLTRPLFHLVGLVAQIRPRLVDVLHVVVPPIFQMIGRVDVLGLVPLLVSLFSNELVVQSLLEHLVALFGLRLKSRGRYHEHGSFFVAVDLVLIDISAPPFNGAVPRHLVGNLVDVGVDIRHDLRSLLLLDELPFGFLVVDLDLRFLDLYGLRIVLFLTIALLFYQFNGLRLFWLRGGLRLISRKCGKVVLEIVLVSSLTGASILFLTLLSGLTA